MSDIKLKQLSLHNISDEDTRTNTYATFDVLGLGEIKISGFQLSNELLTAMEKEARMVLDKKLGRSLP